MTTNPDAPTPDSEPQNPGPEQDLPVPDPDPADDLPQDTGQAEGDTRGAEIGMTEGEGSTFEPEEDPEGHR